MQWPAGAAKSVQDEIVDLSLHAGLVLGHAAFT